MSFIGMGWQELFVIAIAAIVIFGPDRLPEMANQAGKLLRDLRRMTSDMTGEFERQTGVNPLELRSQVEKEVAGFKSQVDEAAGSVQKEVNAATGQAKATATKASKAVNAASGASKSDTKKTGPAKPGASTTTKASAKSSEKVEKTEPELPVVTKKNPFADLVSFSNPEPANGTAATRTNGTGSVAANEPTEIVVSTNGLETAPSVADAAARARQRRANAGYNTAPR